ncbi:uncharacterized protein [Lepeophtheirus salmonis]|uniref:Broadcomplex core protein isoforms 1/2/3/4/5like [Bombyx mori] n=1 Tax=Lepeophtheirus salmonis TaxID=72036 RepID=A0A0K2SV13_LEPSM|nr:protein bric-a-brac 2-like [Lepeophtheirus salmonis]
MSESLKMLGEEYCIKWKGFECNILECLDDLKEDFSDVSISCEEGESIQAHKLVLASCSPYFLKIFKENPCPHPVLILNEVPLDIFQALMIYMYHGAVSLSEKRVPLFLKAAKHLKIKGIGSSADPPLQDHAPNNLSILASAAALDGQLMSRRKSAPQRRLQEYRVPKYNPPVYDHHLPQKLKEENEENMEENVRSPTFIPKLNVPQTTLLTIPDPNVFIQQENRSRENQETSKSALEMSNKLPSPPPEELSTPGHENESEGINNDEEVLMPLTSSATSEQMAALLGPSWKSRQPRMCPYCKRMFSNKFNLKQHILNMHTVGRELQCEQCQKKVKNKWYLRRHHVTHHGAPLKK